MKEDYRSFYALKNSSGFGSVDFADEKVWQELIKSGPSCRKWFKNGTFIQYELSTLTPCQR